MPLPAMPMAHMDVLAAKTIKRAWKRAREWVLVGTRRWHVTCVGHRERRHRAPTDVRTSTIARRSTIHTQVILEWKTPGCRPSRGARATRPEAAGAPASGKISPFSQSRDVCFLAHAPAGN